jgi:hypothetical protein
MTRDRKSSAAVNVTKDDLRRALGRNRTSWWASFRRAIEAMKTIRGGFRIRSGGGS